MPAPFRIRGAAHNHDQAWHSSPGTRRDECFLRLMIAGHGWFSDRLGTIDMWPGHCLLVTPEDPGLVRADPEDPYDFWRISYGGDYAEQLTRRIIANHGSRIFPAKALEDCQKLCHDIGIITRNAMPTDMGQPEALLAQLLCLLLPEDIQADSPLLSSEALRLYIEEQAADLLSVDRIARHFHISPATLNRFCRSRCGLPTQALIETIRVNLAKGLLAVPQLSIQEIARRVGYADPFYFSRVFKKNTGVSPRAWRLNKRRS